MTDESNDLAARIDYVESELALGRLVYRYCHGIDSRDLDTFLSIWHDDAVWDTGPMFGTFSGKEAIGTALTDMMWPAFKTCHHWTVNFVAELRGDRGRGASELNFNGVLADGTAMMIAATYRDEFERRGGVWRIALRSIDMHYASPLPGVDFGSGPQPT